MRRSPGPERSQGGSREHSVSPRPLLLVVFFCLVVGSTGCYTIADAVGPHYDGPHAYGGVRLHFQAHDLGSEWYWVILEVVVFIVDLPLSAVADTAMLPFTLPYELSRE